MIKRILCLTVVSAMLSFCLPICANSADITVSADSAIVMIAATGEIVFAKNIHEKRGIASTTKIMSSLVAIESGELERTTIAKSDDVNVEGTSLGLRAGDEISLITLIKGMLLSSGNDAANVTATLVAGGKESFAQLMNKRAKELGMNSTCFKNPSGLTEEGHYSTAYDMAVLSCTAVNNPIFRSICSMKKCTVTFGKDEKHVTLYNHNKFLSMFDGAFGIKTGFTKASGRCLVTSAERNGVTLVCVTLSAPDDWNDHIKLMELSFENIETQRFYTQSPRINVAGGTEKTVATQFSEEIIVPYYKIKPEISVCYYVPHFVYAGAEKGDLAGVSRVTYNGKFTAEIPLVLAENANIKINTTEKRFSDKIKEFFRKGLSQRQT